MEIKTKGATTQGLDVTSPFSFAKQAVENEPTAFFTY